MSRIGRYATPAGAGQLKRARTALVSGHGFNAGVQNTWAHATMILGQQP
ncbi:MAG TPA: hypothetical protein VIR56_05930 [Solimonas sp.]